MIETQKNEIAKNVSELLLSIDAMTFRFDPPYTYTTGLKSPIYLDNRLIMSYPLVREKIVDYYIQVINEQIGSANVDCVSATATAAIPQGAWVSEKLHLPMIYVRPQTKSYGKGGKVEGTFKKGAKILIIEDHITTGQSVVGNAQAVRELGGEITYCVATTSYETKKSKELLEENKIQLITLTTGKTIVETAYEQKKITKQEKKSIDLWLIDQISWAKKMGFEDETSHS